MKKIINLTLCLIVIVCLNAFGQTRRNVRISPCDDTLCYNTQLYITVAGSSFNPTSYIWSDGSTNSTTNVTSSGVYTVTITGFLGNSNQVGQVTRTKNVVVLDKPKINPITPTWVCTFDTVKLGVDVGYTNYSWNNGSTDLIYSRQMVGAGTGYPALDTLSVWYTASIAGLCEANSDTVVIRGIRKPNGVGSFYDGRTDLTINDSVPAGLVLSYIYDPQYEMEFIKVNDPNYVVTYLTPTTTRFAPLNILDPGNDYYVRTRPIINNITYCWGNYSYIGLLPINPVQQKENPRLTENYTKIFSFYDLSGRLIFSKTGLYVENEWMYNYPNQIFILKVYNTFDKSIKSSLINNCISRF